MRGTEIYIFHGFQVVRSVKIKELKEYELSLRSPPPHGKHCFPSARDHGAYSDMAPIAV